MFMQVFATDVSVTTTYPVGFTPKLPVIAAASVVTGDQRPSLVPVATGHGAEEITSLGSSALVRTLVTLVTLDSLGSPKSCG